MKSSMLSVTVLLALLQQIAGSEAVDMGCVEELPPFKSTNFIRENRANNLLFIPDYKFACYGGVTQWGVFMRRHEKKLDDFVEYNINFQVWRPERSGIEVINCYHFVGNNSFLGIYTESTGRFIGNVSEDHQLEVQPFDIIAVTMSDSMQYTDIHHHVLSNWFSETKLTLIPSLTTVCLERKSDPDSNIKPIDEYRPIITVVVDTSSISRTTSTTNQFTDGLSTSSPVLDATTSPPSVLGTEGVIGISVSGVVLTLIVLLVIVLAYYRLRRKVMNQQVGMTRPLPLIPPNRENSLQARLTDIANGDQGRASLYTRRNFAYNTLGFPAVDNPVERINEDNSEDEGYERIPVPVCGSYERLQYIQ